MRLKFIYLLDEDGHDVAVNPYKITDIRWALSGDKSRSNICFVGGGFVCVQGTVMEVTEQVRSY